MPDNLRGSWDSALMILLLVSLWVAKQFSADFWGVDNLNNLLASVVEIALMGLGLSAVGLVARRRRRAH